MHKILSPIVDYALNYDLLQFHKDRWLFKTITGAIHSSKASSCLPNTSLQDRLFSAIYWKWQHLYLIDAVWQFGFPLLPRNCESMSGHFLGLHSLKTWEIAMGGNRQSWLAENFARGPRAKFPAQPAHMQSLTNRTYTLQPINNQTF